MVNLYVLIALKNAPVDAFYQSKANMSNFKMVRNSTKVALNANPVFLLFKHKHMEKRTANPPALTALTSVLVAVGISSKEISPN